MFSRAQRFRLEGELEMKKNTQASFQKAIKLFNDFLQYCPENELGLQRKGMEELLF